MVKYIATTGFFDGVHKGHVAVLNRLKETGLRLKTPVCAVTFWPHPRIVLNSEADKLKLLSTVEEKKQRIEALGIDRVTVIPFTREFANISPQQFITELVEKYDIAGLCVGYDHHIGKDRTGGFDAIKKICDGLGLFCEQVPPLMTEDNRIISSQKIRERLTEGNVEGANSMLGYSYTLSGTVVHGKQIGRTIGFPTANIELKYSKLIPCDGVYAAGIRIDSDSRQDLKGMLYVGRKSDADNSPKTFIEVNIFDFDRDIYNREISVSFEHFVRKNMKFNDVDEMKAQLTEDRLAIQKILDTHL